MDKRYYIETLDNNVSKAVKTIYRGKSYVTINKIHKIIEREWIKTEFAKEFPITPKKIGGSLRRLGAAAYRSRRGYGYQFDNVDNL